jgi:hypothetical protein
MKRRNWKPAALAVLVSMGLAAGPAQPQDASRDVRKDAAKEPIDKPSMLKIIDPALLARLVALADSAKTCEIDSNDRVCEIEMRLLRVPDKPGGKTYCVAVAPDVNVKTDTFGGFFNKRRIAWTLVDQSRVEITSLDGKALAFHDDAGIVITIDDPATPQVDRRGKRGYDVSDAVPSHFRTFTVRNKHLASATYLPVILWGPPGKEELCAAIDPKIVNV